MTKNLWMEVRCKTKYSQSDGILILCQQDGHGKPRIEIELAYGPTRSLERIKKALDGVFELCAFENKKITTPILKELKKLYADQLRAM